MVNYDSKNGISTRSVRNFTINTDRILSFETDFYHSLSYLVTKPDVKGVLNLSFYSYDYKNYYPVVTYYDVTEAEIAEGNTGKPLDRSKVKFVSTDLDYLTTLDKFTTTTKSDDESCVKISLSTIPVVCKGDYHMPGEACELTGDGRAYYKQVLVIDTTGCIGAGDSPGGGGGSSGGGGSTGGGGSSGGGGSAGGGGSSGGGGSTGPINDLPGTGTPGYQNPVLTTPGGDIAFPDFGGPILINFPPDIKNCEQLKKWTNQQKPILKHLYDNMEGQVEFGRGFKKSVSNGSVGFIDGGDIPLSTGNPHQLNISLSIGGTFVGIAHTHTESGITLKDGGKAVPIFSASDVLALLRLAEYFEDKPNRNFADFFFTLTTHSGTYALKFPAINNIQFSTKYRPFLIDKETQEGFTYELKKNFDALMKNNAQPTANQYEEALLTALEKSGLSIELYKTDNNGGQFGKDWKQLSLNNNAIGNKVKETSCN